MGIVNKKAKILTEFMSGHINNHVALKFKCSRQYVTEIRKKYQSLPAKQILNHINSKRVKCSPPEWVSYKWLIDAKLIKVSSTDFLKNKNLQLTPLGKEWLAFLSGIPDKDV